MNILEACADPKLFAPWFRIRGTYAEWFTFLAALFGLEMNEQQLNSYYRLTARRHAPSAPSREAWLIVGRRGGKSFFMALVAVYLACFRDYRQHLAPGERATVLVIAADRKQARIIFRYMRAMLLEIPMLKAMLVGLTNESFELSNSVTIEVGTASFRSTRGYTFAAVLGDEVAFWRTGDDAANPDFEILDAVRPGLATIPGSMLMCASSPYARRGALYDSWKRHWGKDGAPLVWRAPTWIMNPSLPYQVIRDAMERDAVSAKAEYGAEWRDDIEAFVSLETVERCVTTNLKVRPPLTAVKASPGYVAFVDPSGGKSDSMTLAVAHREGPDDRIILDAVLEKKPPFSPDGVVREFSDFLKGYGISRVEGDRYAGEWSREPFRKQGIEYRVTEHTRSDLYLALLPKLNSGAVDLLDHQKLVNQLVGLERRVARGGKESIDHGPGGHDDLANAVAGAVDMAARRSIRIVPRSGIIGPDGGIDWARR